MSKDEIFRKIYALAKEIRELEPWNWMMETDVFGVAIPGSDRSWFVSVMGSNGEFTALSAYKGSHGLHGFFMLQDRRDALPPETILTIPHLMLSFTDRGELSQEQLETIKTAGIAFRGTGNWPSLEEVVPGYMHAFPEGETLEDALIVFEQALEVIRRCENGTEFLYIEHETHDDMLVRIRKKVKDQLVWEDRYIPIPELEEAPQYRTEAPGSLISQVRQLPESRKVLQLDLPLLPAPVKEPGKKGYFPFGLLFLDKKSGMMAGMEMMSPVPDLHSMYEMVPVKVLEQFLKLGYRPARTEVRSDLLYTLLHTVFGRAGCRLIGIRGMPLMDEFITGLHDHLGGEEQNHP